MRELLLEALPFGTRVIVWIQARGGGPWDVVWRVVTQAGGPFALLLIPLLYWGGTPVTSIRLAILWALSSYLNLVLKELCAIPRPYEVSGAVLAKAMSLGWAFPSGHAQLAATIWPSLAVSYRRRELVPLAVLLVPLVSFSRVYLGVHYPQDVVAGAMLGLGLWLLYLRVDHRLATRIPRCGPEWSIPMVALAALLAALTLPPQYGPLAAAGLAGLGFGVILQERWFPFRPRPGGWPAAGRIAVGAAATCAVYLLWHSLLAPSAWLRAVLQTMQLACLGFVVTWVCPLLFGALNLGSVQQR